jgi:hypothetical protein
MGMYVEGVISTRAIPAFSSASAYTVVAFKASTSARLAIVKRLIETAMLSQSNLDCIHQDKAFQTHAAIDLAGKFTL